MNDFLIEDNHRIQSGTCLIEAFDDLVFVANIDFLDGNETINEYQDWLRNGQFENAIDLSHPGFSPQNFSYKQIDRVSSFKYIFGRVRSRVELPENLNTERYEYGAIGFNFRGVLTRLWNTKGDFLEHQKTVKDYFKKRIMQKIKEDD